MPRAPRRRRRRQPAERPAKGLTKRQQKEVDDISRFIDAHGGKLAPFRGYPRVVAPKDVNNPPATTDANEPRPHVAPSNDPSSVWWDDRRPC